MLTIYYHLCFKKGMYARTACIKLPLANLKLFPGSRFEKHLHASRPASPDDLMDSKVPAYTEPRTPALPPPPPAGGHRASTQTPQVAEEAAQQLTQEAAQELAHEAAEQEEAAEQQENSRDVVVEVQLEGTQAAQVTFSIILEILISGSIQVPLARERPDELVRVAALAASLKLSSIREAALQRLKGSSLEASARDGWAPSRLIRRPRLPTFGHVGLFRIDWVLDMRDELVESEQIMSYYILRSSMARWGEDTYFSGIARLNEAAETARIVVDALDMDAVSYVMNMAILGDIEDVLRTHPERVDRLLRILRISDMLGLQPVVEATRAAIVKAPPASEGMDELLVKDLRLPDRGFILDSDAAVGGALVPRVVRACKLTRGKISTEDVVALLRSGSARLRREAAREVGSGFLSPFGLSMFGAGALKPLAGILRDVALQHRQQQIGWTAGEGEFVREVLDGVIGVVRWARVPAARPGDFDLCDARDLHAGLAESGIVEALGQVLDVCAGSDAKTEEAVRAFLVEQLPMLVKVVF